MSIVVCASEDSAGAKPSDNIFNFSFSTNLDEDSEAVETDGEHDQDDHGSARTVDGVPGYQGETQLAF